MMGDSPQVDIERRSSFHARITAAILLTAITVLSVGCILFTTELYRLEAVATARIERRLVKLAAASAAEATASGDRAALAKVLAPYDTLQPLHSLEVSDAAGRLLYSYVSREPANQGDQRAIAGPIDFQGRHVGQLTVRLQIPALVQNLSQFVAMGGALFFAATALALFLGRWLAARISQPVGRLSQMMEAVALSGDFARRVEPASNDEIGRLTETFNDLLSTLHEHDGALRHTLHELTVARDAAQAANVQKSQFLANMSHEIRTPLNGVLAMAQILARGELAPSQRDQVEVIRSSGEALLNILNDILDVSKIEAGRFELDDQDFDLAELAASVHAGFVAVAQRKHLDFTLELQPEISGLRRGDPTRLRQILNNLVSNALKFTERGGVRLLVEAEGGAESDLVKVSVIDTGVGVAPDKQSMLFEKFSQVDASITRRYGGTGLGLAICHDLARLMGGRVWVESELGQGSAFHLSVSLPRIATPAAAPSPPTAPSEEVGDAQEGSLRQLRVLAAEDNPTNQLVLRTVMDIFGFQLEVVADGRQAFEAWEREPFDVILMDIQMPVMDGIGATRLIRAAESRSGRVRTPIVALSANALMHQVEEYLAAGMDSHVAKPIELAKLQEALEAALSSSPAVEIA